MVVFRKVLILVRTFFMSMKNIILFDSDSREHLLPLTYTRPVAELRVGILTIREKWEKSLRGLASHITQDYLAEKYPIYIGQENYVINGAVLPDAQLCRRIGQLKFNQAILKNGELIAAKLAEGQFEELISDQEIEELEGFELEDTPIYQIQNLWDLFTLNDYAIRQDFALLTDLRESQPLSETNRVTNAADIFIEPGAVVEHAIINAATGPVYIGKDAVVMEGAMIRGPFSLGEKSEVKMGSKIYGATTIGPGCKAGGEIKNAIMQANANKAHEGYLGNSVLGEWCNIGADTNTSNLKNNYEEIKLWNEPKKRFVRTGQQFLGLIMGDHSKCGINTMFNTGTVVGVSANIFGSGYPRNFIPSFSWGGVSGISTYQFDKAADTIRRVLARRDMILSEEEQAIYQYVFDLTASQRPA